MSDDTDELVAAWWALDTTVKEATTERDTIAGLLLERLKVGERVELKPGVGVRVQAPAAVFNPALAHALLSPDDYSSICETKPSASLARKKLTGEQFALCQVKGNSGPSVRGLS